MSVPPLFPGSPIAALASLVPDARVRAAASSQCVATELAALANSDIDALAALVEAEFGIPFYGLASMLSTPASFGRIGLDDCIRRGIYPASLGTHAVFIVADPWDNGTLQWLANLTGSYPAIGWSTRAMIAAALAQVLPQRDGLPAAPAAAGQPAGGAPVISAATIAQSRSAVVRFVDSVIHEAWKAGASDIHFECDPEGVHAKLRLDGVLVPAADLADPALADEVISRIKVLAQLDIAERRIPQDGRFRAHLGDQELDFRVSVMPSIFGEDAVVRLLDKRNLRSDGPGITLATLGLDQDAVDRIRRMSRRPHGMILVTGPTGSGKTTTLYAALSEIRTGQEKIITIEDPVEYRLPGVLQIPVNDKKGLTFSQGLRSILRHDPDKILVGEIRDPETADIAVQAALTGHLVFTTVHANSVFDVIGRFIHMNIDLFSFMSALSGVVAQRLLRCACRACARPAREMSVLQARMARHDMADCALQAVEAQGCAACRQTGYRGRIAIAEVLALDDTLRGLIQERRDIGEIKQHARLLGSTPLIVRALSLAATGITTLEEVDRTVAHE